MDAYQHSQPAHNRTSHLTRLYSDVKKSADTNLGVSQQTAQLSSVLQRDYRTQRDRLISWGLAWSDDEKDGDGNIDDAVARAGLTETVDSVLRNIKDVTEEAERIRLGSLHSIGDSKSPIRSTALDESRYEDLLRQLTTSIDILYDLSMSRRALARGEHPDFGPNSMVIPGKGLVGKSKLEANLWTPNPVEVVQIKPPAYTQPATTPVAGPPHRIEISALRLDVENPPPYDNHGVPSTTRLVARLIRSRVSPAVQAATGSSAPEVTVLVEYANYDSIYQDTHVAPPVDRLEALATYLQPMRPESQTNLSLLGYFEDPAQPRIGLVYDAPYVVQNKLQGSVQARMQNISQTSLLKTLQKARQAVVPQDENAAPALESRFQLALRLTEQLHDLHARDFYHGNINSSSVLFTTIAGENPLKYSHMRAALWTSYDLFSKCSVDGITLDDTFNIYRHPADNPKDDDRDLVTDMRFDLYGLALVLLEVGLWLPISELYKPKYTIADFKLRIERLWIPKLAAKCGSAYMRAVQACLRIADEPTTTGVNIETLFERLLERLRRCCLLDEDDLHADFLSGNASAAARSTYPTTADLGAIRSSLRAPSIAPSFSAPSIYPNTDDGRSLHAVDNVRVERKRKRLVRKADKRARRGGRPDQPDESSHGRFDLVQPNYSIAERDEVRERNIPLDLPPQYVQPRNAAVLSFRNYKSKVVLLQRWWRAYLKDQADRLASFANLKRQKSDAELRETEKKPERMEFPQVQLPQALLDNWHNTLAFQLAKLVEKALNGSPESSSISLTAYGETAESARPTLLICCKSTSKVKHALKRHFRYDPSLFDVRIKKDEIRRCRGHLAAGRNDTISRSMAQDDDETTSAANLSYQSRPVCGASIGAYRDDEHLPPVSFGGIILVDGKPFGMSVHHMLEVDNDDEQVGELDNDDNDEADSDSDTSSILSFDLSEAALSEDNSTVRPPSTIPDVDEDTITEGDVSGISPHDFEEILVTQPALDDAIELGLHVDEDEDDEEDSGIDEDHLLSYKLGQIYASSGLKRTARATSMKEGFRSIALSLPQEIDWALFELVPPRVHPYNVVRGGSKFASTAAIRRGDDSYPVAVQDSSSLACLKVHCLGRTSGLQAGVVSSAMELVKIHGRSTFSASWAVDGSFGIGGDSGAWVIGNEDGFVCGHVLACRRGKTYICPMDLLLQDIKATLGAKSVVLPPLSPRTPSGRSIKEKTIQKAMEGLRLGEAEAGGVVLPASPPVSPVLGSFGRDRFVSPRSVRTAV